MVMRTPICARWVSTVPGKSRTRDGPVFLPPFTGTKTRPVAFLPVASFVSLGIWPQFDDRFGSG